MVAQHTDRRTQSVWRLPQLPASTFHTCIGALSCPRRRGFLLPGHVQTPGDSRWGDGDGRAGAGGSSVTRIFFGNFSFSMGSAKGLGQG